MTTSTLITEHFNVPNVKINFTLDDLLIQPDSRATSGVSFWDLQANSLIQSIFESSGKKELPYTYIAQEIEKQAPAQSTAECVAIKASAFSRLEKRWSSPVGEALDNIPDVKINFTLDDLLIQPDSRATSGVSFWDLQANSLIQSIFESSGKKELSYTYIAQEIDKRAPAQSTAEWVAIKASAFSRLEKRWSSSVGEALEHVSSLPLQQTTFRSRLYSLVAWSVKTIFIAAIFSAMSVGIIGLLIAYSDGSQAIVVSMATLNVEQWASAAESLKNFAIGMGLFTVFLSALHSPFVTQVFNSVTKYSVIRIQTIFKQHPMFERVMMFAIVAVTLVTLASTIFLASTGNLKPANTPIDEPILKDYSSVAIQLEDGTTKTGVADVIHRDDGAWEVRFKN